MAIPPKFVVMPIKRREDPRLISGTATYVDDLQLPGMTYMAVLRSPYAHARLLSIDAQATRNDSRVLIVEIDGETGEITVKRYVAVDDCGPVLNPLLVDGQVHRGIAQGLAQALFEEVVYDENGQLLTVTPSPVNPLGVKGVGEAGTIACSPAVVNAVVDALAHLGVRHIDMPLKSEKIWRILQEHRASRR